MEVKTVWIYSDNYRVYRKDANGRAYGSPIYRESWKEYKIVKETSQSWITEWGQKIPKKADKRSIYIALSIEEVEQRCYIHDHAYKISQKVKEANYETLKKIAELIGYEEKS